MEGVNQPEQDIIIESSARHISLYGMSEYDQQDGETFQDIDVYIALFAGLF